MELKQNQMYKYNEFSVELDNNGKVLEKMPTKRKSVTIFPHEAKHWNDRIDQNRLLYELADSEEKKRIAAENEKLKKETEKRKKAEERLALEKEANDLKIQFRSDIGDDKLREKIETEKAKS